MRKLSLIVLALMLCACGGNSSSNGNAPALASAVSCASLTRLRDLGPQLRLFTNPRTGDQLEYIVVGDGAMSNDLLVMFNGTGGILSDWPIQMITNAAASPKILTTAAYSPSEDGPISLCHDFRLLLFDYPGVGNTPLNGNVTLDHIANDVDAMVTAVGSLYKIPTSRVDPVGWSLGSIAALKYAFLSAQANPARTIHDLVLIATKPGGNTDGFFDGNEASCVSTLFDELKNNPNLSSSFKNTLDEDLFKLTFPYLNQPPNTGPTSPCTATIDSANETVTMSVTLNCPIGTSECSKNLLVEAANRHTSPWSLTDGINYNLLVQQREIATDYSLCYCNSPGTFFNSSNCSCSGVAPEMSAANGGVCQTVSTGVTQPNAPISTNCVPVNSGPITVINGPEDLFIQFTYGQEMVNVYQQQFGPNGARIVTYPGSDGAGHGVLLQHPMWTQQQIFNAIDN